MAGEIVAVVATAAVILLMQVVAKTFWRADLGRFGATALVLLLLPSSLMLARHRGESNEPATILVCSLVGAVLLFRESGRGRE